MINSARLRREILSDGADDYYGLYEIIWRLNSLYPDVPEQEKVAVAMSIIADLLHDGLIEFFETAWASGNYTPVLADAAARSVTDAAAWAQPPEPPGKYLCFAATDAGRAAYFGASS